MPRRRRSKPITTNETHPTVHATELIQLDPRILRADLMRLAGVLILLLLILAGAAYWQQTSTIPSQIATAIVTFLNF